MPRSPALYVRSAGFNGVELSLEPELAPDTVAAPATPPQRAPSVSGTRVTAAELRSVPDILPLPLRNASAQLVHHATACAAATASLAAAKNADGMDCDGGCDMTVVSQPRRRDNPVWLPSAHQVCFGAASPVCTSDSHSLCR